MTRASLNVSLYVYLLQLTASSFKSYLKLSCLTSLSLGFPRVKCKRYLILHTMAVQIQHNHLSEDAGTPGTYHGSSFVQWVSQRISGQLRRAPQWPTTASNVNLMFMQNPGRKLGARGEVLLSRQPPKDGACWLKKEDDATVLTSFL